MVKGKEHLVKIDWMLCHVRWFLLSGVLLIALLNPPQGAPQLYYTIAVTAVLNCIVLLLLLSKLFLQVLPILGLVIDAAFIGAAIYLTGGSLFLLSLLPTIVAAVRFGFETSFVVTAALTLLYSALFWDSLVKSNATLEISQAIYLGLQISILFFTAALASYIHNRDKESIINYREDELNELHARYDRFKRIYELTSTMRATLNYQRVLEAILKVSEIGLGDRHDGSCIGMVLLFQKDGLGVVASRNLSDGDKDLKIKGRSGLVWEAISADEPVVVSSLAEDPELSVFCSLQSCRSAVCVPLRAGLETYGAVLFASPEPDAYNEEHLEMLKAFCDQAVVALRNAQLYQSLREEKDKIIDSEEEARKKLARDLHDGPTQSIAAIAMRLNFIRLLVEKDPLRARQELEKLEDMARRTTREIRTMLFAMRPVVLETQGLVAALEQYIQKVIETDNLPIHLEVSGFEDRLGVNVEAVTFAIIEEAINNAKKHAEANNIYVSLNVRGDALIAEVEDDGKGFDVAQVEKNYDQRGSLGLLNLRERAELVDGNVTIDSVIGRGTKVTLVVPLAV